MAHFNMVMQIEFCPEFHQFPSDLAEICTTAWQYMDWNGVKVSGLDSILLLRMGPLNEWTEWRISTWACRSSFAQSLSISVGYRRNLDHGMPVNASRHYTCFVTWLCLFIEYWSIELVDWMGHFNMVVLIKFCTVFLQFQSDIAEICTTACQYLRWWGAHDEVDTFRIAVSNFQQSKLKTKWIRTTTINCTNPWP